MSKKPSFTRKLLLLLPAAVLLGMLSAPSAGCGDPCVSTCEDAKSCGMQEAFGFGSGDCASFCEDQETMAEELGCGSEYDDFISCFASFDVCANPEEATDQDIEKAQECLSKTTAFLDCAAASVT